MKYPRELMVGRDRSGDASFDQVEVSGAVGAIDVCGEGEDLAVHLEGTVCRYEGTGFDWRFRYERMLGETGDDPIALRKMIGKRGRVWRVLGDNAAEV